DERPAQQVSLVDALIELREGARRRLTVRRAAGTRWVTGRAIDHAARRGGVRREGDVASLEEEDEVRSAGGGGRVDGGVPVVLAAKAGVVAASHHPADDNVHDDETIAETRHAQGDELEVG